MKKVKESKPINEIFLQHWEVRFPEIPATIEFQHQIELYYKSETDLEYDKWLKTNNIKNYRVDFVAFFENSCLEGLAVEFDGYGQFSHSGAGKQRDAEKSIQLLLHGYPTIRFPVITAKSNFDYVSDQIKSIYDRFDY